MEGWEVAIEIERADNGYILYEDGGVRVAETFDRLVELIRPSLEWTTSPGAAHHPGLVGDEGD